MKVKVESIYSEKPVLISILSNDNHTYVYLTLGEAEELFQKLAEEIIKIRIGN